VCIHRGVIEGTKDVVKDVLRLMKFIFFMTFGAPFGIRIDASPQIFDNLILEHNMQRLKVKHKTPEATFEDRRHPISHGKTLGL
jgi:hypothetical protein